MAGTAHRHRATRSSTANVRDTRLLVALAVLVAVLAVVLVGQL